MEAVRKNSRKRTAIMNALIATKEHPTAETVYNTLKPEYPELSLGTVYRNLSLLMEEGAIISVGNVAGQERYDACTKPHAHFVCTRCHRVLDLDLADTVTPLYDKIERTTGCLPQSHNLTLTGVCGGCRV